MVTLEKKKSHFQLVGPLKCDLYQLRAQAKRASNVTFETTAHFEYLSRDLDFGASAGSDARGGRGQAGKL